GALGAGARVALDRERHAPVTAHARLLARRPAERVAREQLADSLEERLLAGHEPGGEELGQHLGIERGRDAPGREDRLDLGGEQQLVARPRPVQRLDAEAVARQEEPPLAAVPDREREHPLEALDAALALLLVEVEDGLGVGAAAVAVAALLELRAQRRVVVDLAVVDEPDALVLVRHRLRAARQVDDREPPVAEANRAVEPQPLAVGAAMAQRLAHALHAGAVHALARVQPDDAGDSTHAGSTRISAGSSSGTSSVTNRRGSAAVALCVSRGAGTRRP